ncbi:hypothetical protein Salat_2404200 [Sesamum alatum]|uniref:Uncharacterized protein n=1 Tax=Sesamum alatum TaxID=300844 RepID=A0AAE2CF77_9LAMI|nr:hypothetical protein Salat_2404200 [Sesamum alatum]
MGEWRKEVVAGGSSTESGAGEGEAGGSGEVGAGRPSAKGKGLVFNAIVGPSEESNATTHSIPPISKTTPQTPRPTPSSSLTNETHMNELNPTHIMPSPNLPIILSEAQNARKQLSDTEGGISSAPELLSDRLAQEKGSIHSSLLLEWNAESGGDSGGKVAAEGVANDGEDLPSIQNSPGTASDIGARRSGKGIIFYVLLVLVETQMQEADGGTFCCANGHCD